MAKIRVYANKCIGCGVCVTVCPQGVYELREVEEDGSTKMKSVPVNEDACIKCYACVSNCPMGAIVIEE